MSVPSEPHYRLVANRIREGGVIPFLGAGANLSDREKNEPWGEGRHLPDGHELAGVLAGKSQFPDKKDTNLLRVSQYLAAQLGEGVLYQYLREIFNAQYPFNSLHKFLASLAPLFRADGLKYQLIITTNYDDLLERAFDELNEPYDLVWYEAKRGQLWGKFLHRAPGGKTTPIERANKYPALSREERTVILKLHGAVHPDPQWDSFVITEDSYIDYLSQGDISARIPIKLFEHMRESNFLFLGYSLRDWNLRVILNRIWGAQQLPRKSWAVQLEPDDPAVKEIEETLWRDRGDVDPLYASLKEYIAKLGATVLDGATPQAGA